MGILEGWWGLDGGEVVGESVCQGSECLLMHEYIAAAGALPHHSLLKRSLTIFF